MVVLSLIVLIVSGMLLFVVPIFKKMYDDLGGTLPFPARMLVNISNLIDVLVDRPRDDHRGNHQFPAVEEDAGRPPHLGPAQAAP